MRRATVAMLVQNEQLLSFFDTLFLSEATEKTPTINQNTERHSLSFSAYETDIPCSHNLKHSPVHTHSLQTQHATIQYKESETRDALSNKII